MINRLSFDTLLSVDASGKHLLPILAAAVPTLANGGISADGLTITYHLRPNVRWQDGVPFTSRDVQVHLASDHERRQQREQPQRLRTRRRGRHARTR